MEPTIAHVLGDICATETLGPYRISIVRNTREQHTMCPTGECSALLEDFRIMAADSFGVAVQAKRSEGIRSHVYNMDLLAIIHDDHEVYGFQSADIRKDLGLCYLHGIAVKQSFQSSGLGKALIEVVLRQQPYDRVAFTTQNPVVYYLFQKLFQEVYPSPDQRIVPSSLQDIGRALRVGRDGSFDPERFVITNCYRECLYTSIPRAHDATVNAYFQEELAIQNNTTRHGFLFIAEGKN